MNTPEAKGELDTESQNQRQRQFGSQSVPISPKRRMLSIEDVPLSLRGAVGELPFWLGNTVAGVIQQLKQDIRE